MVIENRIQDRRNKKSIDTTKTTAIAKFNEHVAGDLNEVVPTFWVLSDLFRAKRQYGRDKRHYDRVKQYQTQRSLSVGGMVRGYHPCGSLSNEGWTKSATDISKTISIKEIIGHSCDLFAIRNSHTKLKINRVIVMDYEGLPAGKRGKSCTVMNVLNSDRTERNKLLEVPVSKKKEHCIKKDDCIWRIPFSIGDISIIELDRFGKLWALKEIKLKREPKFKCQSSNMNIVVRKRSYIGRLVNKRGHFVLCSKGAVRLKRLGKIENCDIADFIKFNDDLSVTLFGGNIQIVSPSLVEKLSGLSVSENLKTIMLDPPTSSIPNVIKEIQSLPYFTLNDKLPGSIQLTEPKEYLAEEGLAISSTRDVSLDEKGSSQISVLFRSGETPVKKKKWWKNLRRRRKPAGTLND